MRITNIEINFFRSLANLDFPVDGTTVICGPNSCGKSNVLRALKFAFLPNYSAEKMGANLTNTTIGPNAAAKVKITFDKPRKELAALLEIDENTTFTYQVSVKRNANAIFYLNGKSFSGEKRAAMLEHFLIISVPPIRDLAAGGLLPFSETLAATIRKTRGPTSLANLNKQFKAAIHLNGKDFLSSSQVSAKTMLGVDELSLDLDRINLESLLPLAGIKFTALKKTSSLDKLGTGHQSTVILSLYRQLGTSTEKFVIFLFEEPDNHLHPTSLPSTAKELQSCAGDDSQVFVTTHSPYLINQFSMSHVLPLKLNDQRCTERRLRRDLRDDRQMRIAFGKYGLMPIESLLCKKVIVVEGPNDVTLLRTAIELSTALSPDQQDLIIVPAGGKDQIRDLCILLTEIGANWCAFFDWDATQDTRIPIFQPGLTPVEITQIQSELDSVLSKMNKSKNPSRIYKMIQNCKAQVGGTPQAFVEEFSHSALGKTLSEFKTIDSTGIQDLEKAVKRKQISSINRLLLSSKIRVWSGDPEMQLLTNAGAKDIVEDMLIHHKLLKKKIVTPDRDVTLFNKLHGLAHYPDILSDIILTLSLLDTFPTPEVKAALRHIAQ